MGIVIKLVLLVILVKLLMHIDRPYVCSGIYTGTIFVMGLGLGAPFVASVIASVFRFGLTSLYYWLLYRYEDSPLFWWTILILGMPLSLIPIRIS